MSQMEDKITYEVGESLKEYHAVSKVCIDVPSELTVEKWVEILKLLSDIKGFVWESIESEIVSEYALNNKDNIE